MGTPNKHYKKYQKLVLGKNINPQTLLATDYLNHFNEIHMLLGMIIDMPECIEDILEWKTITYQQHFKFSVFQDKELAIDAYEYSPEKYKKPFENCVARMDNLLLNTVSEVEVLLKNNNIKKTKTLVANYTPQMEKLIEQCSGIINSKETTTQQDIIDDYFDHEITKDDPNEINQVSIDDLFD